ncbi:MAG: globin [Abditibacteriaceae bacterium]
MNPQQINVIQPDTIFEAVGGEVFFQRITRRFYAVVENDPLLRPMYPDDLSGSILHLELFLIQYFGGPRTYHELRGHPKMRMRHIPFTIGQAERDAWMYHMRHSVKKEDLPQEIEDILLNYFERTATFMMNK